MNIKIENNWPMNSTRAQAMTLREAMAQAARRGRAEGWPRCYYWSPDGMSDWQWSGLGHNNGSTGQEPA